MTNREISEIAMCQSALDSGCEAAAFSAAKNSVVISKTNQNARKYLDLPFICDLTSYGSNIVASVSEALVAPITEYVNRFNAEYCFSTPNIYALSQILRPFGADVCFMGEYFLPDVNAIKRIECEYETKLLYPSSFAELYLPEWNNALCEKRKELDVLAVGAFHIGKLIGLAGCSKDCESMWQIGVDVLPEYRRQGIASALTSRLAIEVLDRGIVPFYCCAWANIKSAKNAVRSGFRPAWAQLTAKSLGYIEKIMQN